MFSGNPTLAGITNSGNLTFTGTGNRIIGDFTNATISNRVMWQTSTTNGITSIVAIPNGTATQSALVLTNNSDPTNASLISVTATATETSIRSSFFGSGTYLPLTIQTGGSQRLRIGTDGTLTAGGHSTTPALKVVPVASQARWVEVTGATSSGNPIVGTSGGDLRLAASSSVVEIYGPAAGSFPQLDFTYNVTKYAGIEVQNDNNLRLKTGAAGVLYEQVRITATASATRFLTLTGSNGGNPTIGVSGGKLALSSAIVLSQTTLLETSVALTNGAAAAAGTLLNAPAAGNPTKWIPINDNGTTRYIPAW